MSPVHQVWPKPSCKAQWKGEEDKADRGRGGKTASGNGQVWSSPSPRGRWRTGENVGNWLRNHLWCPNDPRGYGIDEDDNETGDPNFASAILYREIVVKITTETISCLRVWIGSHYNQPFQLQVVLRMRAAASSWLLINVFVRKSGFVCQSERWSGVIASDSMSSRGQCFLVLLPHESRNLRNTQSGQMKQFRFG